MIIPTFLEDGDVIGVTACSSGVLDKIDKYEKSINNFLKYGFKIIETANVRTNGVVSSNAKQRAEELISLYNDDEVKAILIARGGDFLFEMIEKVDFSIIKEKVKWIGGSSDPTSLLFIITTNYDIATIYTPCNLTNMDRNNLHGDVLNFYKILKGQNVKQCKFDMCEAEAFSGKIEKKNEWININGDVLEEGVLIGGCIDCLKDVIGTKYDYTREFIKKYKADGIIWFFDIFSMSAETLYNTLWQFKYAGWFEGAKAVIFGKVAIPSSINSFSYEEMIKKALPNVKVVFNFDVGHVKPSFTLINGMKAKIVSNVAEGSLEFLF